MSVRPCLPWPHEKLAEPSGKVVAFNDHVRELVQDVIDTCEAADAKSFSAIQIGAAAQIIYISKELAGQPLVLINPVVEERGAILQHHRESCASTPGIIIDMQRAASIQIAARNVRGDEFAFVARDLLAQAIQHELQHLEGRTIIDAAKKAKRWFYRDRMKKYGGAQGNVLDYRSIRAEAG